MCRKKALCILAAAMIASTILGACASPATPAGSPTTIRVALLPILDAFPMYVAQEAGLFEQHDVMVEFIPVQSAPQRDQLIVAGEADAMINEVLSTMFLNQEEIQAQTVRFARTATETTPLFRILSAPDSGITAPEELKNQNIGVSQGTVIEYLTERLLEAEGLSEAEIRTVAVPDITSRMALLREGELPAAMLPEPLSSLVVFQGSQVVLDDTSHPEYSFSTITFRRDFIEENPEAVRGFLAAVEDATSLINSDASGWRDLLQELQLVPEPLLDIFQLPLFPTAGVPTEDQWQDAMDWAMEKDLLDDPISYADSVTSEYLP